ncbi:hypothetical protein JCM3765_000450 [Sporobolomyces pararoseus]
MFESLTIWFKCHQTPPPSSQVLDSPISEAPTSPVVAPTVIDPSVSVDAEGEKGETKATTIPQEKWYVRCFGGIKKCCGFGKRAGCPCGFGCKSKKEVVVVDKKDQGTEKNPTEQVEVINETTTKTTTNDDPFLDNSSSVAAATLPGGGAELTRTDTISANNNSDEPVVAATSSPCKKGTFYEKCKGFVLKGGKENEKK